MKLRQDEKSESTDNRYCLYGLILSVNWCFMTIDEYSNLVVSHKINKSEVDYGILNIREKDFTKKLLSDLPARFTMIIKSKPIENRKIMVNKVWIGFTIMEQFEINDVVKMTRKDDVIYVD